MQTRLFLVDVDGTLIDIEKLKKDNRQRFAGQFGKEKETKLWQIFDKVRGEKGFPDIKEIATRAAQELNFNDPKIIENFFVETNFRSYLFPSALALLKRLKKGGKVLIYSQGDGFFQPVKIKESGIEEAVGAENVIIQNNKAEYLTVFKKTIENEGYEEIVFVDNSPFFLEEAKKVFPEAKLVLVTEGKYNI